MRIEIEKKINNNNCAYFNILHYYFRTFLIQSLEQRSFFAAT